MPPFILASASPARRRLLESVGIIPLVQASNFDETSLQSDDPITLVEALARAKAESVASFFSDSLLLGCDSLLYLDGQTYGKPENTAMAIARWQKMRGQVGVLYTGHALIDQIQTKVVCRTGITQVYFADIDDDTIAAYVASGEPLNCAGAFALEGKGGLFIEKIEGCHSNVIGLSLPLLHQMLHDLNYSIANVWNP